MHIYSLVRSEGLNNTALLGPERAQRIGDPIEDLLLLRALSKPHHNQTSDLHSLQVWVIRGLLRVLE